MLFQPPADTVITDNVELDEYVSFGLVDPVEYARERRITVYEQLDVIASGRRHAGKLFGAAQAALIDAPDIELLPERFSRRRKSFVHYLELFLARQNVAPEPHDFRHAHTLRRVRPRGPQGGH